MGRGKSDRVLKTYTGQVVLEPVSPGSKSERVAAQLDTGEERLLLRRPGTGGYRDAELEGLVGKRIRCLGLKRGARLYVREWSVVDTC